MIKSDVNAGWIRCGKCGHKLGKIVGAGAGNPFMVLEVKCHSCKELNIIGQDMPVKQSESPLTAFTI